MKNKYADLIDQTFDFPQDEFVVDDEGNLEFHGIPLMKLIEQYGSPLKFTYLPKISENIQRARNWFRIAMASVNYVGEYKYCYCTKSSHFRFVIEEALKNNVQIETSSAFDLDIVMKLHNEGKLDKDKFVICNGFKTKGYIDRIGKLVDLGFENCYPIIDNVREIDALTNVITNHFNIGIRIASEEEPKFEFYTSRLGIGYRDIVPFYKEKIQDRENVSLRMLHFFINTGITDTAYYWNELRKCLKVYCDLRKECETLDSLNIGGGFPIKRSLSFEYDYQYMVEEIVFQIKQMCQENGVPEPNIFTEFGSFTVGESGGTVFSIVDQKRQNDRERWDMINSSFMTTLPDAWAISQRFILLPINNWNNEYERVLLGGLTCDSDDYYNSEQHVNAIYLPKFSKNAPLHVGFFNTGAYQESLSGYGGTKHCLIPAPKYVVIDRDADGNLTTSLFADEQDSESMLKVLGY